MNVIPLPWLDKFQMCDSRKYPPPPCGGFMEIQEGMGLKKLILKS